MIYNLFFLSAAAINFGSVFQKSARDVFYYLLLIAFFLFVAFRWDVGCDWGSYFNHARLYGNLPLEEAAERSEPLYWLLVTILPQLGMTWPSINLFSTLTFFAGLHVLAKRQPDRLLFLTLSFPTLITGIPMSALRQAFAMGFIMAAFAAFTDLKRVRYTVLVVLGGLFHASAFAFLLLIPFISRQELRRKFLTSSLLLIPAVYLFSTSSSVETYGQQYINSVHDAAGGPARIALLSITAIVFIVAFRKKWQDSFPQDFQLMTLMSIAMIALFPVSLLSSVIGDRFGYYLAPIAYIMQSRFGLMTKQGYFLLIFVPILVGGLSLFIWSNYSAIFSSCYLPYQHWFTEDRHDPYGPIF